MPGQAAARPAPPTSASAKAPPPPSREPDPPPEFEDDDFDDAPTSMFVHPVKYTYDPDAPPQQPGLLDEDDDDDEDEPPTAIHVSPYRGDGTPGMPEAAEEAPKPQPAPRAQSVGGQPQGYQPQGSQPQGSQPGAGQPQGYHPPGVGQQAPASAQRDPRMFKTQQLPSLQMGSAPGHTGPGIAGTPVGQPMVTYVDPDAAPVWLKALALSSVVSALTVLGVLGWMLSGRL